VRVARNPWRGLALTTAGRSLAALQGGVMATALRTKAEVEHDLAFWTHEQRIDGLVHLAVVIADAHDAPSLLDEWERLACD
jgi:hypothetical protein